MEMIAELVKNGKVCEGHGATVEKLLYVVLLFSHPPPNHTRPLGMVPMLGDWGGVNYRSLYWSGSLDWEQGYTPDRGDWSGAK